MQNNETLLFMHLPKTAGTSLRLYLASHYENHERVFVYDDPTGIPLAAVRELPGDRKRHWRLVYGHFHFGIHELLHQRSQYVTVLRHPVDRVVSLYFHHLAIPGTVQHDRIKANNLSLAEFAESGSVLEADNGMTRAISGVKGIKFGGCSTDVLHLAMENIRRHFALVMTMETLASDVERLDRLLGLSEEELPTVNVNSRRPPREAIDPSTIATIRAHNAFDLQLYEHIRTTMTCTPGDHSALPRTLR